MSVLSVEPLALGGPGEIGAERAHRPGSRRPGGVEATGASVATADSWPDRRKGWASPEWGPALRLAVMGGMGPGRGALTSSRWSNTDRGWGLCTESGESNWPLRFLDRRLLPAAVELLSERSIPLPLIETHH